MEVKEGNGSRISVVVENVWAKAVARYVLPAVVSAGAWWGTTVLSDLRDNIKHLSEHSTIVRTEIAVISQKLESDREVVKSIADQLRKDVDTNDGRIGRRVDQHDLWLQRHDHQIETLMNGRHP